MRPICSCRLHGRALAHTTPAFGIPVAEYFLNETGAAVAKLIEERDAYRAQATSFAETLVRLGYGGIVDRVLANSNGGDP